MIFRGPIEELKALAIAKKRDAYWRLQGSRKSIGHWISNLKASIGSRSGQSCKSRPYRAIRISPGCASSRYFER